MRLSKRWAWLGGLATAVLAGLIVEWTKDFPVLRALGASIAIAWRWLLAPGTLPHWLILVLALSAIGILALLVLRFLIQSRDPALAYTADSFLGLDWHWAYSGTAIYPDDVVPLCPKCRLQMTFMDASHFAAVPHTAVVCEDCGHNQQFEGNQYAIKERVIKLIQRNLRTGGHLLPARDKSRL